MEEEEREMGENKQHELERVLGESIQEGGEREPSKKELTERARERISAPYVYRITADRDPVAEETKLFRRMAKEVDDRYDRWGETEEKSKDK
jgi:hypothetical protein